MSELVGRRVQNYEDLSLPGDYCGPINGRERTGYDRPAVFYVLPDGEAGDRPNFVLSPPHEFHEHADGSLSITASILHTGFLDERRPHGTFHGYLNEGHRWTWD